MNKRVRAHVNPLSVIHEITFDGFGNDKPILVDVGAFKGEFMWEILQKHPDYNFILFEIRRPIAEALREKFKEYKNVVVFDGDAGLNFKNILQPCIDQGAKIEQIFVNFPDPWFKDKHKKRRFITTKFLESCASWLPVETKFIFQTDQKFMFDETLEYLAETDYNNITRFEGSAFGIPTDWEKAKLDLGQDIYRMEFVRK